jgi:hypothetical protein
MPMPPSAGPSASDVEGALRGGGAERRGLAGGRGVRPVASQYDRAAEALVPVSQYSVMLSSMWSRVRLPEGSPSTKARTIL